MLFCNNLSDRVVYFEEKTPLCGLSGHHTEKWPSTVAHLPRHHRTPVVVLAFISWKDSLWVDGPFSCPPPQDKKQNAVAFEEARLRKSI